MISVLELLVKSFDEILASFLQVNWLGDLASKFVELPLFGAIQEVVGHVSLRAHADYEINMQRVLVAAQPQLRMVIRADSKRVITCAKTQEL